MLPAAKSPRRRSTLRRVSRANDFAKSARLRRRVHAVLVWAVTAWLLFAFASEAQGEPAPARGPEAAEAETVRLRCWQEGRLIFEHEELASGSVDTPGPVKLSAATRDGGRLRLLEVGQATCLTEAGERS